MIKKVDEVRYSKDARNFLKKADTKLKSQIKEGIDGLKVIPPAGDVKPLEGYRDGRMRLRIGKYRIIFRYDDDTVLVLYIMDIGARGDIYK